MKVSESTMAKLLVLPSLGVFSLYFYGFVELFHTSFLDWKMVVPTGFIGLGNYLTLFSDRVLYIALQNSVVWTAVTVTFQLILGLASALALNVFMRKRGSMLLRAAVLLPWAVPSVVSAMLWKWMMDDVWGILNYLLSFLGIHVRFLTSMDIAMWSLIVVGIWKFYPFATLTLLARLQVIPPEYYEAAKVDGAGGLNRLRYITLPMLRDSLILVILMRTIFMFTKFDIPWTMTQGGPGDATTTLPILVYRTAFIGFDFGLSSAASAVLFLASALLSVFVIYGTKRKSA